MRYKIEDIVALIGARRYGNAEANIEWLLTDSRSLVFPETSLFFAIKTNIEKANCDKFQETLNALTAKYDARYFKKKPSEKEEQLFSHDETKAILD